MKLSSALASDFSSPVRTRGFNYYRSGAVKIRKGSDVEVEARVRGARDYQVEISLEEPELNLWCDCAFFESSGPCKHLWATVLAAEASGYLKAAESWRQHNTFYDLPEPMFEDELDEEDGEEEDELGYPPAPLRPAVYQAPPKVAAWQQQISEIGRTNGAPETWPEARQIVYVVDVASSRSYANLLVKIMSREPKKTGGWKKLQSPRLTRDLIARLPDPADRQILAVLSGVRGCYDWSPYYEPLATSYRLLDPVAGTVVPLMAASGRLLLQKELTDNDPQPLAWDDGEPWIFRPRLERNNGKCALVGLLRRGEEEAALAEPALVTPGLVFWNDRAGRLNTGEAFAWMAHLRKSGSIEAPQKEADQLLAAVLEHPAGVEIEVPEELRYEEVQLAPRPRLTIRRAAGYSQQPLHASLAFEYGERTVAETAPGRGVYDAEPRRFVLRDSTAEQAARELLRQAGFSGPQQDWGEPGPTWRLSEKKLAAAAHILLPAGWHLEAEGKIFRKPGQMRVEVSSGVDWFELHGEVAYGDTTAKLPALLTALRRGENMVRLDDGTYGLLPEDWLKRFGMLAGMGTAGKDHVRFGRNQIGLLDALLATQPEIEFDETFGRAREELRRFDGIKPCAQPAGFRGQLRDYQREGVGWMEFLRRFGFGGCLADDMGVGKTAQVLAMLEARRSEKAAGGPSLVVVPKSLVFNWKQEAARFTPEVRVLDHTGISRSVESFGDYDLILTTYGTLRRDALEFKDIEFDYIVLDEAQAIKNAATESAKAARLLRGRHRLALSGTPVENHLGELWSLFEFLNPGMLGAASVFKLAGGSAKNPSEEARRLLAQALRPFFLRRTKEQVARELPQKSEQTIFCEMEPAERRRYDELRAHYRNSLLHRIDTEGMGKSKIQVLEALLRLRQAACHPGLLDERRRGESSAKLDLLLEHLGEVAAEGHKALVFSQFTSLLSIVRQRLDAAGIAYEYLDGATRDRRAPVERFQNDADCRLFLISLKAGGLGLNLTAAEYIFLLDPWWNPAVEAQAIDRAHRIGQTRPVFAYRLIARDTVEEKVLQLQQTKRDLAAAILGEDNSLIRNLQREDLELLLS